ncbi:uncharacterized protein [Parasteatoda tepidariorum]|uniref:uncharacterized protein n=1 Tax=Parasteatoda tepidariorum TaxID=114398 RepID=UPI00077FB7A0|nr:glucosidase 2 subunit beta [Parasteatoda tepidariorum]
MFGRLRCRYFFLSRRYLFVTAFVVVIFLLYQFMSVKQLSYELSKRKPRLQKNFRSYEKAEAPIQREIIPIEEKQTAAIQAKRVKFVRGVLPEKQKFYQPSNKNTFVCLNSREEISFSFVNDNFCDCSDFSDEPSTSACNYGRFYCNHQSNRLSSVVSYKVNDGVCDCCDGSDEWEQNFIPPHVTLQRSHQKGLFQAPCPDHCLS